MGDGRAEGSSATGDGEQAATSLTPDTDGTGAGSLLDSILFTLLKKRSSDVWVVALILFQYLQQRYCTTILYTVLYSKVHKSTTSCRGCKHGTTYGRHVN